MTIHSVQVTVLTPHPLEHAPTYSVWQQANTVFVYCNGNLMCIMNHKMNMSNYSRCAEHITPKNILFLVSAMNPFLSKN
jgi:hypothetical protein